MNTPELWSIEQVRAELGAASTGSARRTLSRWGVRAVEHQPDGRGHAHARYDAQQVRDAKDKRPGRGKRTDLPGRDTNPDTPTNNDPANLELRDTPTD